MGSAEKDNTSALVPSAGIVGADFSKAQKMQGCRASLRHDKAKPWKKRTDHRRSGWLRRFPEYRDPWRLK